MILSIHVGLKLSLVFVPPLCTSVALGQQASMLSSSLMPDGPTFLHGVGRNTDGVVEARPAAPTPSQQPATDVPVPQPARPDVDNARAPESVNADDASAAARDQEEQANEEAETAETDVAGGTRTQAEVKPTPGTNASCSWPATAPDTPERDDVAPTPRTEHAQAAVTEPDVYTAKPEGCTTPPPVHDSEGSDTQSADGRGSPLHGTQTEAGASVKRDVAASKSRLFAFRSFTRDKKVIKPAGAADTASPDTRKAGEAGAENKDKGKERSKRFWK